MAEMFVIAVGSWAVGWLMCAVFLWWLEDRARRRRR